MEPIDKHNFYVVLRVVQVRSAARRAPWGPVHDRRAPLHHGVHDVRHDAPVRSGTDRALFPHRPRASRGESADGETLHDVTAPPDAVGIALDITEPFCNVNEFGV